MFRKIVSNIPFSPALVGQLRFYAKRLRKEETTRRLGLIFIALTLVVQSFAVFQPSESANASSETDMVSGGIGSSINNFLKPYDANTKHLRDTMNYVGITRNEIASSNFTTFKTGEKLSWGFASRFSYAQGERQHSVTNDNGDKVTTVYSRPLKLWGSTGTEIAGWVGHSEKMGWFAIMQSCGNLVTIRVPAPPPDPVYTCDALTAELVSGNKYSFSGKATASNSASIVSYTFDFGDNTSKKVVTNPIGISHTYANKGASYVARLNVNFKVNDVSKIITSNACTVNIIVAQPPIPPIPPVPPEPCFYNPKILASDKNCLPCPGNETLWIYDESCTPNIVKSKTATNTSQGFVNALSVVANAGDQISYTITIENTGLSPETVKLDEHLGDILEYATLSDNGGGTLNESTKILSWSDVTLDPKGKQTRTFVVNVQNEIPSTAKGASDPTSYDCIMSNVFGNSIDININCPTPKIIENVTSELPKTGPTENIIFSGITLAFATYFYARSRQTKKEIYLIRKDANTGTI